MHNSIIITNYLSLHNVKAHFDAFTDIWKYKCNESKTSVLYQMIYIIKLTVDIFPIFVRPT